VDPVDLAFAGIARQAEMVRAGEVSSKELVELYLERIERIDPELNSYRVVMAERALAEAGQADARRRSGEDRPLLGVPIAIKDNIDIAGEVTTHGTGAYGEPAQADSEMVRRLREAGAVILGKTHLPELAIFPFTESATWGTTRNPWDVHRSTGGSSGGSAAAVAAGLAAGASASDGGGSIRFPAACCGLFGLKPQRGRVSLMPDAEHWFGLSVYGAVTRTVMDTALYLDATAGPAPGDAEAARLPDTTFAEAARRPPGKLRIAMSLRPAAIARVQPEVRRGVEETAELLRSLGHEVERVDPPYGFPLPLFLPRWLRGIHDDAAKLPYPKLLERRVRRLAQAGGLVSLDAVARARSREPGYTAKLASAVFSDHDVLLTPTMPELPWRLMRWQGLGPVLTTNGAAAVVAFANVWNLTGQPAASVPAGFTDEGLPRAVQLVGRPHDEATLLSLAAQIEAERPWAGRRPPLAV
jgi:amidase